MADRPPAVAARTSRSLSPTGKNWRLWCPKLPAAPASCGLRTAVSADSVTVATLYGPGHSPSVPSSGQGEHGEEGCWDGVCPCQRVPVGQVVGKGGEGAASA